ncbi:hypothetical protein [Gottfriedia luciferensis]|uniref:hypothetical protein n=1 Tax=Gottfriedia luciferensis TaxID=178774 RepID=UPI001154FEB2|nr:hypothetical protein [Gottfriedia luciferensis]
MFYYELCIRDFGVLQYFTNVPQKTRKEIINRAEKYFLISKSDFPLIEYARQISLDEAEQKILVQID